MRTTCRINNQIRALGLLVLGVTLCAAAPAAAWAQQLPDKPPTYVVDLAKRVSLRVKHELEGFLKELEDKTTVQLIVLVIDTTDGVPIRDYAITVAHDKWKLGHAGQDNGVLVVVAVQDRKYSIEVGYGLEGALPDGYCGRVARETMVPNFKNNDYSTGVYQATLALTHRVAQEYGAEITGMPVQRSQGRRRVRTSKGFAAAGCLQFFIFAVLIVTVFSRNRRRSYHGRRGWAGDLLTGMFLGSMLGGGRHRGGGFGGGGFGGFGGGGGGGFGGGGASGGW